MSWNISTRLNNLQQQVNNIANTGLTNPMEQILNANNFAMQNLSILNANSNVLQLQTNNIGGITTNSKLTVGGDLTCNTLNYTALNPPINTGEIEYDLLNAGAIQNSFNNFSFNPTNPYTGIITKTPILNPIVSGNITFNNFNTDK